MTAAACRPLADGAEHDRLLSTITRPTDGTVVREQSIRTGTLAPVDGIVAGGPVLRREVTLARRVTHRNVARVFDVGERGGQLHRRAEVDDGRFVRRGHGDRRHGVGRRRVGRGVTLARIHCSPIGEAIQQMWRTNLGVDVNLVNEEWKVYIAGGHAKSFQLLRAGWIAERGDTEELPGPTSAYGIERLHDPKLAELKGKLDEAKQPLPVDPKFARLQRAVQLSEQQLKDARLTAAQDLAWALINNPSFLFNR